MEDRKPQEPSLARNPSSVSYEAFFNTKEHHSQDRLRFEAFMKAHHETLHNQDEPEEPVEPEEQDTTNEHHRN